MGMFDKKKKINFGFGQKFYTSCGRICSRGAVFLIGNDNLSGIGKGRPYGKSSSTLDFY